MFDCPGLQKHHQNSTRRPPEREREKKNENGGGRGKNKREILGCPAECGPVEGGPAEGVPDRRGPAEEVKNIRKSEIFSKINEQCAEIKKN